MIEELDLRSITRLSNIAVTSIIVQDNNFKKSKWIIAGVSSLYSHNNRYDLKIPLNDIRDEEHGFEAYALSLPLVGLRLSFISNGMACYEAIVDPTSGHFNDREEYTTFAVPKSIEELTESLAACTFDYCSQDSCRIGKYIPRYHSDLFHKVAGLSVTIWMGPGWSEDE